ncbi:amino acid ABC transporter permease [Pseudoruegeria sp. HB172150]|uniref:amino acid ABC transporter permease n=1 Tax=Pseudoruegeria sp. HB172150 TaxID=2721164 RepID=UPI0015525A45|nr:amino acid ABC transporter permease [Pseudoruegeria sp. HB172150]
MTEIGTDRDSALALYETKARLHLRRRNLSDWAVFLFGAAVILWGVLRGADAMHYNWQWYRIPQYFYRVIDGELIWGPLVRGLIVTLQVTLWAAILAFTIGLTVALLRLSRSFSGRWLSTIYLEAIRNTPLLVQMYLFYFVLSPILGIERFWTGVLCLAFFEASFISEIIRGGILSVPKPQWEAASSLGLGARATYQKVVLPQAVPLMLPPLTSSLVNLVKASAIVSTIAVFDLTNEGRNVIADTFMTFEVWLTVAAMYLVLTISLSAVASWMERRVRRSWRN